LAAVNQSYQANHWYRLEVAWGSSGKIVGKLFDSNGTTLLRTVTASTTAITAGGIAVRATGSDKYFDTVTASYGVNSFAVEAASASRLAPSPAGADSASFRGGRFDELAPALFQAVAGLQAGNAGGLGGAVLSSGDASRSSQQDVSAPAGQAAVDHYFASDAEANGYGHRSP